MIMDYMDEDPFGLPPSARATSHQEKPPKQWDELRHEIKKTRRLAQNLTCRVPLNFTFRHLHTGAGELTRLYFLGMPQGYRENTLLYVDLPVEMRPESEVQEALEWKPLLDSFHSLATSGQFSKEEQLMRERRRVGGFGITSYDYNDMNGDFVFSACNSLYLVTDSIVYTAGTLEDHSRHATECRSSSPNSRLDAFMCPHNPKLLAYVSGGDLWVTNLFTGHEQRLTHTHTNEGGCRSNPVSAGVPSFVMQEEFDRYIGYWWQPSITQNNVYMILYEEVDESDVEILHLSSPTQDSDDEFRYPRAGSTNAMSSLKIVQFQLRRNGSFKDVVIKTMAEPITALFPDTEYIVHIGWHPSGESFHALLLNRRQQKLKLVLVQLSYMNPVSTEPMISDTMLSENVSHRAVPVAPVQILLEQSTSTWINTSDILHFLPSTTPGEISFIWSDERTGYRHLYLVNSSLARPLPLFDGEKPSKSTQSDQLQVNFVVEKALTMGDWAVSLKQINVDEENHLVYFTARKDTPLESHLYCVSYENPGVITRLTTLGYSHNVTLDIDCSMFVTMYSSIDQTQACEVYQINTSTETDVLCTAHPIATLLTHAATGVEEYKPPKLFEYKSDGGHTMHGMVYSPHNYKPNQQYPTVLYVYGGPQVQMVSNAYKGMRFLRLYTLAQLGYAVIVIDSRGSSGRGVEFESYIRDNMGHVEIQDQVDGLHWLAERVSYIDLNRVAIHGWSYGGFLSLMGLAQRPDVFKLAIAGAPVVSWNLYDTGYTERYMGLPHDNPQVYKRSSVLEYVERLPSLPNRLLIVHGLIDENVHFAHTLALISSLVKCVKPYQLQIFPNERHGIRISSEHYETTVLSFLQQNL